MFFLVNFLIHINYSLYGSSTSICFSPGLFSTSLLVKTFLMKSCFILHVCPSIQLFYIRTFWMFSLLNSFQNLSFFSLYILHFFSELFFWISLIFLCCWPCFAFVLFVLLCRVKVPNVEFYLAFFILIFNWASYSWQNIHALH